MPAKSAAPTMQDLSAASAQGQWGDDIQGEIDDIRKVGRLSDAAFSDELIFALSNYSLQSDSERDEAFRNREDKPEPWKRVKTRLAHELLLIGENFQRHALQSGVTPEGFDGAKAMKMSDREFGDMRDEMIAKNDRGGLRA